jgi:hypothetical protein
MKTPRLLIAGIAIGLAALAQVRQTSTSADKDKETLIRRIRFGNRELNLPSALQNDELEIKNHRLENDIAQLEGREKNLTGIAIDQFLIDQDKAAIQVATWFAVVWSRTDDKGLQEKLSDIEKHFDEAQQKCRPSQDDKRVVFEALEEAKAACADLQNIYQTVSQYHINSSVTPSLFKDDSARLTRGGYQFLMADEQQLRLDTASNRPKEIKQELIKNGQLIVNLDRLIWLQEILDADTVKYNAQHPEHQMADTLDLTKYLITFRERIVAVVAKERKQLLDLRKGR